MGLRRVAERLIPTQLNDIELELVKAAERIIVNSLDHAHAATITIERLDGSKRSEQVPQQMLSVLAQVLRVVARQQPVMLVPEKMEYSTAEAAQFLNVSRLFVVKEAEAGRIKCRRVGKHRRISLDELLSYEKTMRSTQQDDLDTMASNRKVLGLEY